MRAAIVLALLVTACGPGSSRESPERARLRHLSQAVAADGDVTAQEAVDLAAALQLLVESEERREREHDQRELRGWITEALWFVAAVASSMLGVNIYRNRSLPGANRIHHP